jgi:hypothetical protein
MKPETNKLEEIMASHTGHKIRFKLKLGIVPTDFELHLEDVTFIQCQTCNIVVWSDNETGNK